MAIYHLSTKTVSRASGRSAVAASAYRSGECLTNELDGVTHDYSRRDGVSETGIALPRGVSAEWAKDRETLWNTAELAEKRKDARTAREIVIALPEELTREQRRELTGQFAQELSDRYGVAVDFAIHDPHRQGDQRNFHAHLLMTTRKVEAGGLGAKSDLEREDKALRRDGLPTTTQQISGIRVAWQDQANRHLAQAGHDVRIDHRSHAERGFEIEPTDHMGVNANNMERAGKYVSRARVGVGASERNAEHIRENPGDIIGMVVAEKSVFTKQDLARAVHRYVGENEPFQRALSSVMSSPELVQLQAESKGQPAHYSTAEIIRVEGDMAKAAQRMADAAGFGISHRSVSLAIDRQDREIGKNAPGTRLSAEQRAAVEHITDAAQIAAVIGVAGAGKSTMLAAAKDAWTTEGRRVFGAALAGKAAEGLQDASGIESRTLKSWEVSWQNERDRLQKGDVFVIDEAGMIGSRQLASFIDEAERAGAKLVLVGDHEQLQAIGAGAAFRAIAERTGAAELREVRRQREDWQRGASLDFATHRTAKALDAYAQRGHVQMLDDKGAAIASAVSDYLKDREARPDGSRLMLAHRRSDVAALNELARNKMKETGRLQDEKSFDTTNGKRSFATGDRFLFLANDRELGVKNGRFGVVESVSDHGIRVRPDGASHSLTVNPETYRSFDHGYAATIHKTQGATVDRAFVVASTTMDRHLSYVGMTRHRDSATLYAGRDEFSDMRALTNRLGRDGSKETTLDYTDAFALRRGIEGSQTRERQPAAQQGREARELPGMRPPATPPQIVAHHPREAHTGQMPAEQKKPGMLSRLFGRKDTSAMSAEKPARTPPISQNPPERPSSFLNRQASSSTEPEPQERASFLSRQERQSQEREHSSRRDSFLERQKREGPNPEVRPHEKGKDTGRDR